MVSPLITEMAVANFHKGGLRAARIGKVDLEFHTSLKNEAMNIVADSSASDVQQTNHVTNWTKPVGEANQWSLYNRSGNTSDTSADFDYRNLNTKKPIGGPAIDELTESIPDLVNLRLNRLGPHSRLSPHEEHTPRIIDDERVGMRARFHIPLITNPSAHVLADNYWYQFTAGNIYYFNNGCVHAAVNDGDTPRFHLVFDVLMTERAFGALFAAEGCPRWMTPDWDKSHIYEEEVTEWEPSGGVSWDEFSRRTLSFIPAGE